MWTILIMLVGLAALAPLVAKSISGLLQVLIVLAVALAMAVIRPVRRPR